MDISVSRLNKRMALQLPAEFPLGLVFVVGEIAEIQDDGDSGTVRGFYLSESNYTIYCRLSHRAALEVRVNEGDLVRAGGHLAFEPVLAGYYLMARDVEVLSEYRPGRSTLSEIIADNAQRTKATNLVPAELPPWIEQLAPPEIREELAQKKLAAADADASRAVADSWIALKKAETKGNVTSPAGEPTAAELSAGLVDFLSEAMESTEDIELTPELLADYESDQQVAELSDEDQEALRELEAALIMTILKEDASPEVEIAPAIPPEEKPAEIGPTVVDQDGQDIDGREATPGPRPKERSNEEGESSPAASTKNPPKGTPKEPDQTTGEPEEQAQVTQPKQVKQAAETSKLIPWYLVALAIFLAILLVTVFVFVTLNSSSTLPLPFSLSG